MSRDSAERSSKSAVKQLALSGDFGELTRRLMGRLAGRPLALPENLLPNLRAPRDPSQRLRRTQSVLSMVGTSLQLDGAPLSQFELAEGLAKYHTVRVLVPADGPLRAKYEAAGIEVTILPDLICSASVPSWYEMDVQRLAESLSAEAPCLLFVSSIDSFAAIDAARIAGIRSIWNIRESEAWRTRLADRHPEIARRALASLAYPEATIFVAGASRRAWGRFGEINNHHVIYNAAHPELLIPNQRSVINARQQLGASEDEIVVASVGTLCERKGQIDLVQALNTLPASALQKTRVAFVGKSIGRYRSMLEDALSQQAAARTRFVGQQSDASSWITAADILVNTSRSEAFPRTFIEAAAGETSIIATAIDGAAERLADGESALFYDPMDVTQLRNCIVQLLGDASYRSQLARGAKHALIDAWSYAEMIGAYQSIVEQVLLQRARDRDWR